MADAAKWQDDALVRLQDSILPVILLAQGVLLRLATALPPPAKWEATFDTAIHMLRHDANILLTRYGVTVTRADQQVFDTAADAVAACRAHLRRAVLKPDDLDLVRLAHEAIVKDMHPTLCAAINRSRALFISLVIARNQAQVEQANVAITGLDKISKQIFFISINASVEAARVGDAGRGFSQISTEIRALSQSAQDATRELSDLVARV